MSDKSPRLYVLLHGWLGNPKELDGIRQRLEASDPAASFLVPDLGIGSCFCLRDPWDIVDAIFRRIGELDRLERFSEIVLVGYSCGALIAQGVFCQANGGTREIGEDRALCRKERRQDWASRISRVVLIAGVNRGWSITSATPWLLRLVAPLILGAASIFERFGVTLLVRRIRRGAPFITTIRLQWLELSRTLGAESQPVTVQLLGTRDDVVSPGDCVDPLVGRTFYYIEVPQSSHWEIIRTEEANIGPKRLDLIACAVLADEETLEEKSIQHLDVDDYLDLSASAFDIPSPKPSAEVSQVFFLIHGIRDHGYWTKKLAVRIKALGRGNEEDVRTITSSYGFFGMGKFLFRHLRLGYVDWLMDQYVTARALYPNAEFSCAAHSNGSYLVAKALADCPAMRFERVAFAGSVVHQGYDWESIWSRQVERVRNYVATNDVVVALFPRVFELLPLQDLGSAGHNGFKSEYPENAFYVKGGHGAALEEDRWREIASFLVGHVGSPAGLAAARTNGSRLASLFCLLFWAFGLVVLVSAFLVTTLGLSMAFGLPGSCVAMMLELSFSGSMSLAHAYSLAAGTFVSTLLWTVLTAYVLGKV